MFSNYQLIFWLIRHQQKNSPNSPLLADILEDLTARSGISSGQDVNAYIDWYLQLAGEAEAEKEKVKSMKKILDIERQALSRLEGGDD